MLRPAAKPGDERAWYYTQETGDATRQTSLARQSRMRDGVVVNFWVEEGELHDSRLSPAILDGLVNAYERTGGIYETLVGLGGEMWGAHSIPAMISAVGQPVDIVILNFDRYKASGMAGYFYGVNAFRRVPGTDTARSNEAVALFMNSREMYPDKDNRLNEALLTAAHESMHMQNFYRRGIRLGDDNFAFDVWLDEGTAVMTEDLFSARFTPGYDINRDIRIPAYLKGPFYNCGLMKWPESGDPCDGYTVWASFGNYLNRQLGVQFFRNLLNNATEKSSAAALEAAIRSVQPSSDVAEVVRRWTASVGSLMPGASIPADYGYPARPDATFPLASIELQGYVGQRVLPNAIVPMLSGYAAFPVVRRSVQGAYREIVRIPPRSSLTVVIHDGKV